MSNYGNRVFNVNGELHFPVCGVEKEKVTYFADVLRLAIQAGRVGEKECYYSIDKNDFILGSMDSNLSWFKNENNRGATTRRSVLYYLFESAKAVLKSEEFKAVNSVFSERPKVLPRKP